MTRTRLAPLAVLAACTIGNNKVPKPSDLPDIWHIDRIRLLAVRATPPEIGPGDTATFEGLIVGPGVEDTSTVWLACPTTDNEIGSGCAVDLAPTDTGDSLASPDVIGLEPGLAPVYTAPDDLLDGVDADTARRGVYVLIQAANLSSDALAALQSGDADVDFNEVEVGYKRLVVSDEPNPNANPTLTQMLVDGIAVPQNTVVEVQPNEAYDLTAVLADDAIETYDYIDPDGETESRTEEPWTSWYTTDGTLTEAITLHPFLDTTWQAPDEPGSEGRWWIVIRDRRGGMGWLAQPWRVIDP